MSDPNETKKAEPLLTHASPGLPPIEIRELGGKKDGVQQAMDRRLFVQLLVFTVHPGAERSPRELSTHLAKALERRGVPHVVYDDVTDPRGIGVCTFSDDPTIFVDGVRPVFEDSSLRDLQQRHDFTMMGRTYGQGHEPDLEFMLIGRPRKHMLDAEFPWAVWYPLRRTGAFAKLEPKEQSTILREHATIGLAYGQQDLAHDVRLACHGIDAADNEFVVGLLGRTLHPLSHVVQAMRKTKQTSEFIAKMGPFFVGYARHRFAGA